MTVSGTNLVNSIRAVAVVVALALAAALADAHPAVAQTSVPAQAIQVTVALPTAVPAGVSGYRVDAFCSNVPLAAGTYRVAIQFPRDGGSGALFIPVAVGVSCIFRLTVQGTGPRGLIGGAVLIGGALRAGRFLTTVDGTAVDPNTVFESDPIPVEAPTNVIFGDPTTLTTTTTTTTSTTTTSTSTTTTTRPPTTIAPTPIAPTTIAPTNIALTTIAPTTVASTTAQVTPATKAPAKKLVRVCTKRVKGRCVASKLVRR